MAQRVVFVSVLLASLLTAPVRAPALELSAEIQQMYSLSSSEPPTASQMMVCYGFVCRLRSVLAFDTSDHAALTAILAKGQASPEAEREAVRQAVVWFDRRMGPVIGTSKRVARADFRNRDDDHNFDCWDTTRNTVSLLLVLQEWRLLRHHTVGDPKFRGNILWGQTPHNTAILVERKSGKNYVVDMWTTGYAQLPDMMPLEKWMDEP